MKKWIQRFLIFLIVSLGYYFFVVDYINEYVNSEISKLLVLSLILISLQFIKIFINFVSKKRARFYPANNRRRNYAKSKELGKWILFLSTSIYLTLFMGHLLTSGFSREYIGNAGRNFLDIEHTLLMTNDDLLIAFRCGNIDTTAKFLKRNRDESYLLVNLRRGYIEKEKLYKPTNQEKILYEQIGTPAEQRYADGLTLDWAGVFCEKNDSLFKELNTQYQKYK
tara:strand:+ start:1816 stop:2487 length:672 start_codon:yes stop_codon:yes gene_type:complete